MSGPIEECLDGLSSTVQMNFTRPDSFPMSSPNLSDDNFRQLGDMIAVRTDLVDNQYKPIIREILLAIHEKSSCAIDRYCVSGTLGTQPDNSLDDFGFDITIFLDCSASHQSDTQLHMQCAIQSFEKIYSAVRSFASVHHDPVECDHRGVHFFHESGLHFHLAVFPSLGHRMHLQRKSVWDLIEQLDRSSGGLNQNDLDKFSIGLHESVTSFMHLGDPVCHGLVRLARFWRSQVLAQSGAAELSPYAVVLIMMRCIEDEKARRMSISSPTLSESKIFIDFLSCLSHIDTMSLTWQRFYEPDLVPERHLASHPLIVDPVNPWRNVVRHLTSEQMETIKMKAKESLKKATIGEMFGSLATATRGA